MWFCQTLANCRSEVCKALGIAEEQCELSMGMSGDFELAVRIELLLCSSFSIYQLSGLMFFFSTYLLVLSCVGVVG